MDQVQAVFFDIGETLATPHFSPAGRLASLEPLPGVSEALDWMRNLLRLGIISNTGAETFESMRLALAGAGLYSFLSEDLLIYSSEVGMKKDSPVIFRLACQRTGLEAAPERCLFVGEDADERAFAAQAGMRVAASVAAAAKALTA